MAEPIGIASGLVALATFAFESGIKLAELVRSFNSHQQRVRDLVEELNALNEVLSSLSDTIKALSDINFSPLKIPLLRCGKACTDFEEIILKVSKSSGNRTSFRDWTKLKYMGEDIDGFRRLLAGYKQTISIALLDANLRRSSATAENIEAYNDLLNTARADLEDRLQLMDEKLELILEGKDTVTERAASEVDQIRQERLSTEKCLQICAQLSSHIAELELTTARGTERSGQSSRHSHPEDITTAGLRECKESLARTAQKLEGYEKELFAKLLDKSKTVLTTDEQRVDLTRLRDEWEATRQGMEVCCRTRQTLKDNASTVDNYATGDAVQFMVSTNDKIIHGHNRGLGWRTRQVGGHLSDESLQRITRALTTINVSSARTEGSLVPEPTTFTEDNGAELDAKFTDQYGRGVTLTSAGKHRTS